MKTIDAIDVAIEHVESYIGRYPRMWSSDVLIILRILRKLAAEEYGAVDKQPLTGQVRHAERI